MQFLLHVMGTEQRQTFNHIVDLRQRAMALELETDVDGELAYLIVTKVPSLRGSEVRGTLVLLCLVSQLHYLSHSIVN